MTTWSCSAVVVSVIDGDSMHFDMLLSDVVESIGLGLELSTQIRWRNKRCRVLGIDAPELMIQGQPNTSMASTKRPNPAGEAARDFAKTLLPEGSTVELTFARMDDRGRPLVQILLPDGRDFGTVMLLEGHAVKYPAVGP